MGHQQYNDTTQQLISFVFSDTSYYEHHYKKLAPDILLGGFETEYSFNTAAAGNKSWGQAKPCGEEGRQHRGDTTDSSESVNGLLEDGWLRSRTLCRR
ncbi:hypothetical protein F0562_021880 [Nyssa sinensis]|uniref:Uncharacterized protein n=1 Tax=Nyssa sinensis TaxID=561372 RepID=A0A5J5BLI6_9ASTE|nr:hypothetical protein F0562_021880 [Nyssa sinensis]